MEEKVVTEQAAKSLRGRKDNAGLNVKYETWGNPVRSDESVIGVRVDYRLEDGSYAAGKLYTVGNFNYNLITPFGSKTAASEVVSMGDLSGTYDISFADAPANWDGRIMLTYMIKDAGEGATTKFIIRGTEQ